VRQSGRLS